MSIESRPPQRKQPRSQQLDRALKELESAFSKWNHPDASHSPTTHGNDRQETKPSQASEEEFKKKTKKLLTQLREQLAELTE